MNPIGLAVIILAGGLILYSIMGKIVMSQQTISSGSAKIDALARAIAFAEGSPASWNNPGDLTKSFGYPNEGPQNTAGVLKFSTLEDGWRALYVQMQDILDGNSHFRLTETLEDFGMTWAGDPNWAVNVAKQLGVTTNTTLAEVLNS